jgi:capsular polysaccharide transport system permease protein
MSDRRRRGPRPDDAEDVEGPSPTAREPTAREPLAPVAAPAVPATAADVRAARRVVRRARRASAPAPRGTAGETLPQAIPLAQAAPAAPPETPAEREARIAAIQRDLVRRRRRRTGLLALRLLLFVLLPTLVVGWYYFRIATDMFEVRAEFVIQKAEGASTAPALGGILSGLAMADARDSMAVQGFLSSPAAFERLDAEHGFVAHFQNPAIDELQRLAPDASRADAHDLYRRHVIVGFDQTEGIIRMSVIAADGASAERFAKALIAYAEEMVDSLSARAREENMRGAEQSFADRQADVEAAAGRVLELQRTYATFSAEGELQVDLSVIQAQTLELEKLKRDLNEMQAAGNRNQAQIDVLRRRIDFTQQSIDERRAALTANGRNGQSLAEISSALQMARSDLAAKEQMRVVALGTLEQARIEAARQVRYLSVNVPPTIPDRPTYPRRYENTAVAFFIFLGLYVMISLTLSILREQVSV